MHTLEISEIAENLESRHIVQKWPFTSISFIISVFIAYIIEYTEWNFNFWSGSGLTVSQIQGSHLAIYFPNEVVNQRYIWQYVTHFLLHHSFLHLFVNICGIAYFGVLMERKYGWKSILPIFFLGCISGGVLYVFQRSFSDKHAEITMFGASGGVYSLIGLFVLDLYLNYDTIPFVLRRFIICLLYLGAHVAEYFIYDVSFSSKQSGTNQVAVWGHFGGLLFGISPAIFFIKNNEYKCWESIFYMIGFVVSFTIVFFGILIYTAF